MLLPPFDMLVWPSKVRPVQISYDSISIPLTANSNPAPRSCKIQPAVVYSAASQPADNAAVQSYSSQQTRSAADKTCIHMHQSYQHQSMFRSHPLNLVPPSKVSPTL